MVAAGAWPHGKGGTVLAAYRKSQPSPGSAGLGAGSRCCCGCWSGGTWCRQPCGESGSWSTAPGTRLRAWGGLGTPHLPVGSWVQHRVRTSWARGPRGAAGQPEPFPLLAGTSVTGARSDACPLATGTPRLAPTPHVEGAPSSGRAIQSWLQAGTPAQGGGTGWRHPAGTKPSPAPWGSPVAGACGKPQAIQEPPSSAGASEFLRSREHTHPTTVEHSTPLPTTTRGSQRGQSQADTTEPCRSPPREAPGAGTRLAPTLPAAAQQRRGPGGNDTPHPIPSLSSHAAPPSRGDPMPPHTLTAPDVPGSCGRPARPGAGCATSALLLHGGAASPGTRVCPGTGTCTRTDTRVHTHRHAHAGTWLRAHPHARTRVCTPRPRRPGRAPDTAAPAAAPAG